MSLAEYKRKRDFERTREPKGVTAAKRSEGRSYLIQKHDASRLHYDFRLELDGVLLSWAVTKGPSLDPSQKRLAVKVEDHPLAYGTFEGTIPKGEYGGGTVMLWDEGTWDAKGDPHEGLEKGHLSFVLHGERLRGGWDLIRMHGDKKRENWLLIKEKDPEAHPEGPDILGEYTSSVTTGRSMDEIAQGQSAPQKAVKEKPVKDEKAGPVRKNGTSSIEGVKITHADRIVSEAGHVTKGELAEYYSAVAPLMIPRIARHPLSLLRCPSGLDQQCFYQRGPGKGLGAEVLPFTFRHDGKANEYIYIEDAKGLLELVQMGVAEMHPWGSAISSIDCPDRMTFDLDPGPGVSFDTVKEAAQDLRARLKKRRLKALVKCTGGNGLHVIVPLAAEDRWPEVKQFASDVAHEMESDAPDSYVTSNRKASRQNRIFVDYLRNDYTATAIADYSVRARAGAPVAVPLEWRELDSLRSGADFKIQDVLARIKGKRSDPFSSSEGQRLTDVSSAKITRRAALA